MKMLSLLKAILSEDINPFAGQSKNNGSEFRRTYLPLIIFTIVCVLVGIYINIVASDFSSNGMMYVLLTMIFMMVTVSNFIGGIYKSQGMLFDNKDNDLLFSMPIKKSEILFARTIKLLAFQYIYNLIFMLPTALIYIYYEIPGFKFYFLFVLMSFLVPIIPTILASVVGYIIKLVSLKFRISNLIQPLLSIAFFGIVFYISGNIKEIIIELTTNAKNINEAIMNIYYPIGLFINLMFKFKVIDLIKLIVVNIIPLLFFVLLGSKLYFNIVSKSMENISNKNCKKRRNFIIKRMPMIALIRKEIKRYFSSPMYIFNACFSLLISVAISVFLLVKGKVGLEEMQFFKNINIEEYLVIFFSIFVLFTGTSVTISSSSISLEGRSINIIRSFPIKEETILKSKILACYVIELPVLLFADFVYIFRFDVGIKYSLIILLLSFVVIMLMACIGLIANLKYPKMGLVNDIELGKQSISAIITTLVGIGILFGSLFLLVDLCKEFDIDLVLIAYSFLLFVITVKLYDYLMVKGPKEYRDINV